MSQKTLQQLLEEQKLELRTNTENYNQYVSRRGEGTPSLCEDDDLILHKTTTAAVSKVSPKREESPPVVPPSSSSLPTDSVCRVKKDFQEASTSSSLQPQLEGTCVTPKAKQQLDTNKLLPQDLNEHCSKFLADPKEAWKRLVAEHLLLIDASYGENDEGDYDYYTVFRLVFKGTAIWSGSACRSSNIGCAWGSQLSVSLSGDSHTLVTRTTNVDETIRNSRNTRGQEKVLSVLDILKEEKNKYLLTSENWAELEGLNASKAAEPFRPSTQTEQGSTWQLHNNPW